MGSIVELKPLAEAFIEYLRPVAVLGRITKLTRRVPFQREGTTCDRRLHGILDRAEQIEAVSALALDNVDAARQDLRLGRDQQGTGQAANTMPNASSAPTWSQESQRPQMFFLLDPSLAAVATQSPASITYGATEITRAPERPLLPSKPTWQISSPPSRQFHRAVFDHAASHCDCAGAVAHHVGRPAISKCRRDRRRHLGRASADQRQHASRCELADELLDRAARRGQGAARRRQHRDRVGVARIRCRCPRRRILRRRLRPSTCPSGRTTCWACWPSGTCTGCHVEPAR